MLDRIRYIFVFLTKLLLVAAIAACGGGGSSTTSTTSCGGSALQVTLSYGSSLSIPTGQAQNLTPTVTGLPSACVAFTTYALTSGALPAGLSLNATTGAVTGTVASMNTGSFKVEMTIQNYRPNPVSGTTFYTPSIGVSPSNVSWALKTANHGMTSAVGTKIVAIGTDLYSVTTIQSGGGWSPSLHKSSTGGASWTNLSNPPPGLTSVTGHGVVTDGTDLFLVSGQTSISGAVSPYTYNNNVLKYTVASNTWSTVAVNPFAATGGGRSQMGIAYDSSNRTFYMYGGTKVLSGSVYTYLDDVYASSDGGQTWIQKNNGTSSRLTSHCLIASNGILYSIGGFGYAAGATLPAQQYLVSRSTDGGVNWAVHAPNSILFNQNGACAKIGNKFMYAGGVNNSLVAGGVYQSADLGATWTADAYSSIFDTRSSTNMTVLGGKALLIGGFKSSTTLTDVLEGAL